MKFLCFSTKEKIRFEFYANFTNAIRSLFSTAPSSLSRIDARDFLIMLIWPDMLDVWCVLWLTKNTKSRSLCSKLCSRASNLLTRIPSSCKISFNYLTHSFRTRASYILPVFSDFSRFSLAVYFWFKNKFSCPRLNNNFYYKISKGITGASWRIFFSN